MTQFLKYLSFRLVAGTLVAIPAVYRALIWYHEVLYSGDVVDDWKFILATYLTCLLVVWVLFSLWGALRFSGMLAAEMEKISRQYHPQRLVRGYRRLMIFLESAYFSPWSKRKLERRVAEKIGATLLGMRIEDEQALGVYEKVLQYDPDADEYYKFLVFAYSRSAGLSERSWKFIRRRYHEHQDDKLVGVLSREYVKRRILRFESERVLLRCLTLYPEHRKKVLAFAIPGLLRFSRLDDNAVRFYLASLADAKVVGNEEVMQALAKAKKQYDRRGRRDQLAIQVAAALSSPEAFAQRQRDHDHAVNPEGRSLREVIAEEAGGDFLSLEVDGDSEGEENRSDSLTPGSGIYSIYQMIFGRMTPWLRYAAFLVILLLVLGSGWYAAKKFSGGIMKKTAAVQTEGQAFEVQDEPETPELAAGPEDTVDTAEYEQEAPPEQDGQADPQKPQVQEVLPGDGSFTIQVYALSDSLSAVQISESLKRSGVDDVYIVSAAAPSGRKIFKVRIGRFSTNQEANSRAEEMTRSRRISEWQVIPFTIPQ